MPSLRLGVDIPVFVDLRTYILPYIFSIRSFRQVHDVIDHHRKAQSLPTYYATEDASAPLPYPTQLSIDKIRRALHLQLLDFGVQ